MKFGEFFKPMLLNEQDDAFDDENYIFELKLDGYRATLHVSPNFIKIYSRNGIDLTDKFPELDSIKSIVKKETIFDGEIVAFVDGKPSFSELQKRGRAKSQADYLDNPVSFVAFDCLYANGKDLTEMTLMERKRILEVFPENDSFVNVSYVLKNGIKLFDNVKRLNLEGIVAKRKDSKYYPNSRSQDWIKIKNYKEEKFLIGGYVKTNFRKSILLGEYRQDGKFYFVGKVTVDKSVSFHSKNLKKTPFCNHEEKGAIYFSPKQYCKVVYIERTSGNNLREPVFKGMV